MTAFAGDPDLTEMTMATDRLLETVHHLDDHATAAPSLCPGWTRGHVLAHVARNADGLRNLLTAAATGVPKPAYASAGQRAADIEAGARRRVADLEADLEASAERLLAACAELPESALDTMVALPSGRQTAARHLPWVRLREVEYHHVDLDVGYDFAHSPAGLVARGIDECVQRSRDRKTGPVVNLVADDGSRWTWGPASATVHGGAADPGAAAPTVQGSAPALLGWLTGRSRGADLVSDGALPALPPWG